MQLADKTIVCAECQQEFVHSADDQRRFQERGFANEPRRCPPCREKRRLLHAKAAEEKAIAEGTFVPKPAPKPKPQPQQPRRPRAPERAPSWTNRNPRNPFGSPIERRGNAPVRESHEIVCAECGKRTTVPFKPFGNRPVYCRDCYRAKKPPEDRPQTRTLDRSRPSGTFLPDDD